MACERVVQPAPPIAFAFALAWLRLLNVQCRLEDVSVAAPTGRFDSWTSSPWRLQPHGVENGGGGELRPRRLTHRPFVPPTRGSRSCGKPLARLSRTLTDRPRPPTRGRGLPFSCVASRGLLSSCWLVLLREVHETNGSGRSRGCRASLPPQRQLCLQRVQFVVRQTANGRGGHGQPLRSLTRGVKTLASLSSP